ncbi:polysaccharide deacetylase family protein [Gracilibacillus oryzae]|uniref:Polysaccharide deacetylase family protein n=1 Tax=Gracilibacillus oryzae TaxID=1672701 RepID=A0A7C8GTE0_9BACI|nr:polysaccharide deacetylase family protein [Gracilibacillus oryzae]KAB8136759.1 polysaccharide deacetylase family protein [Gracilibacillus oryzae]
MKFKKWLMAFIGGLLLIGMLLGGFNMIVDPFGVFGDKVLKWDSYNMVNNPRVAKIAYLDEHHEEYDSYIIGGSKSSSISPELLNKYYGDASFYSMMMYGGDFHDYEKTLYHLIDNYEVKNIVLHMSLQEIGHFHEEATDFKQSLHAKVTDEPLLPFYLKYLWLNPAYGYDKLAGFGENAIDPMAYSQIIPETGVYNKVERDKEDIDNLDEFWQNNPNFELPIGKVEGQAIDQNVESLKRMKEYAEEHGATFTFITGATYKSELQKYNMEELKEYWVKLAEVTDFWDFSGYTSMSNDPRYYYDSMHYRNSVGEMMLGYIYDDPEVYVPEEFGHYTTKDNVEEHIEKVFTPPAHITAEDGDGVNVPVLMYHHIAEDPSLLNWMIISPEKFRQDMTAIKEAGFNPIHLKDLAAYVNGEGELPEKPVVITFDDGYLSNYQYAYPVLKELNMKATIFMIGWSAGRDTHRIEGADFYPHFTWQQAQEMHASGLIELQNHSFDMHEGNDAERFAALPKEGETTGDYARAFMGDTLKIEEQIEQNVGNDVFAYAYPYGEYVLQTEQMLKDLDYDVTLSVNSGMNTIRRGDPSSLFALKRINAGTEISSSKLVEMLSE